MKSILVEFARFKNLGTGILRDGDDYLRSITSHRVHQVRIPIDQRPFNQLMNSLRYVYKDRHEYDDAFHSLSSLVTNLLRRQDYMDVGELLDRLKSSHDEGNEALIQHVAQLLQQHDKESLLEEGPLLEEIKKYNNELQQIDLVTNAAELSALPFEAAMADDEKPLFLNGKGVVLTRRVRGVFRDSSPHWPATPKVLFIWSAAGGSVPHKKHREALLNALKPWLPPKNREKVFVEIGNAKYSDIEKITHEDGFTHCHLLAHGQQIDKKNDHRFGIALNHRIEGADVITPDDLCKALAGIRSSAVVVTLAACDAGNETDVINPDKSLAHLLHTSGFPVVIASQLPLTMFGSEIFTRRFYGELLNGLDVREALHHTRVELYDNQSNAGHDWVSLVGYVQLPEGYSDFLEEVRLKSHLNSLKNLRDRSETLAQNGASREEFETIGADLKREIEALNKLLAQTKDKRALDENRGLLGSAEKRLAELLFKHIGDDRAKAASREALSRASKWYKEAFDANPSHHWSGVQYLALQAVMTGKLDRKKWKTAYRAAEVDRVRPNEYWAQGSLTELALLGRLIGESTDEPAATYLQEMKDNFAVVQSEDPGADSPFLSTELQLRRYVEWWLPANGFFADDAGLADEARELIPLCCQE
ncbi:CHAT domain-containing protein [Candidatus Thiodiazotropha sp. CDECU1]|uniref:CHAT domain-containing protein n=1 Tax=Candidatus Thiodiazotropha sp. CDECU1 TaxID=3065865 RepID=UPI00292DCED4|nr:CHAT domain-containing protein [Candidatus Thiodiazotropha sp. CDECU1]